MPILSLMFRYCSFAVAVPMANLLCMIELGVLPSHVMYVCAFLMLAVLSVSQIHVDSCFYQSPENGRLLPLEAHEWHSLKFGDSFSLMVDKYIFKVLSAQPVESAERYQYLPIMILFSATAFFLTIK